MKYLPFERWVTVQPAPDLHQYAKGDIQLAPSYSRRKAQPNTGKWFKIIEVGDGVPPYAGPGCPVICNLSMISDELDIGKTKVAQILFTQCAGTLIGEETMRQFETNHPILPFGDYVLCIDNDDKHAKILGAKDASWIHESTLRRGQRTDEQYETKTDENGFEIENPNRQNDGVKVLFTEVVMVGPDVPEGRLAKGDMVAFRPNVCGIGFDCWGKTYRLVRCQEKNPEIMGKVPASQFSEAS